MDGPRSARLTAGGAEPLKLVLVMVGLPARGKTFIARKIARYLGWLGRKARVFNVGSYRRARLGSQQGHEFFNPDNEAGSKERLGLAMAALDDLLAWMAAGGEVGIYDATNSTRERRAFVHARCKSAGYAVLFIESICADEETIDANVRETKLSSPDYATMNVEQAAADFRARIAHYARAYEPVDDETQSYVKLVDVGQKIVVNRIQGYTTARLVVFLMNLHVTPRAIWLTRHGESEANVRGVLGGDAALSPRGEQYARLLTSFFDARAESGEAMPLVWTSTLRRSRDTARHFRARVTPWRALDEIDAGICDGLTYAQVEERMPEDAKARAADKFRYRYPRGESYEDVIQRLEPVLIELERQREPVLVVAHQAVLRALYAYLRDLPAEDCPLLPMPLHTVIELVPRAYGCDEQRFVLDPNLDAGALRGTF